MFSVCYPNIFTESYNVEGHANFLLKFITHYDDILENTIKHEGKSVESLLSTHHTGSTVMFLVDDFKFT